MSGFQEISMRIQPYDNRDFPPGCLPQLKIKIESKGCQSRQNGFRGSELISVRDLHSCYSSQYYCKVIVINLKKYLESDPWFQALWTWHIIQTRTLTTACHCTIVIKWSICLKKYCTSSIWLKRWTNKMTRLWLQGTGLGKQTLFGVSVAGNFMFFCRQCFHCCRK